MRTSYSPLGPGLSDVRTSFRSALQFQPGATISVKATPEVLLVTLTGQPAFPVFATGKDQFDYDVVVASLSFERDDAGKVVAVVLHQNGMDMRAPKR